MQKPRESKPILVTIEIGVLKDGKRKLTISGAPEKEMPVVRTGIFADVHTLFDQVWIELQKREPQPITIKATPAQSAQSQTKEDDGLHTPIDEAAPIPAAPVPSPNPVPIPQAPLPTIEGDTVVDVKAGADKTAVGTTTEGGANG